MKKLVFAALLMLPLFAVSAHAQCCGGGQFRLNVGVNVNWCYSPAGCCPGTGCGFGGAGPAGVSQLGPWYEYWPMEAHFQTPAPTGYPYWPAPLTLPPNAGVGAPAPGNFMPASLQPSGYGAPPPSYWSR
jgi:hypothetical protein